MDEEWPPNFDVGDPWISLNDSTIGRNLSRHPAEVATIMDNWIVNALFIIAYCFVFLCCILGNIVILTVILAQKSMRTVTNFFLANLAVADLLVGIFCVIQNAIHFSLMPQIHWPFGQTLCYTYVYFLHFVPSVSAGILVLLSLEKCVAVVRPMSVQGLCTKPLLISLTCLVWLLSALTNSPYGYFVRFIWLRDDRQTFALCTRRNAPFLKLVYYFNFILWYVIPLVMLLVIYALIGYVLVKSTNQYSVGTTCTTGRSRHCSSVTLRTSLKRTSAAPQPLFRSTNRYSFNEAAVRCSPCMDADRSLIAARRLTVQCHSSSHGQERDDKDNDAKGTEMDNNNSILRRGTEGIRFELPLIRQDRGRRSGLAKIESRRRVIRLVVAIVTAFALLSLPRYAYQLWNARRIQNNSAGRRCIDCLAPLVQPLTFVLQFLNSGINPFLYAFFSNRFRTAVRETFVSRKPKNMTGHQQIRLMPSLKSSYGGTNCSASTSLRRISNRI